jgi:uncharacterized RDD family membrane protein YckC
VELIDPDLPDDSEEQFAASLETAAPPPRYTRIVMPEPEPQPEPQFAAAVHEQFALAPSYPIKPKAGLMGAPPQPDPGMWRQEVSSRLQSYRARRRRRTGRTNSMELDFDPRPAEVVAPPAPAVSDRVAQSPAAVLPAMADPAPPTVVRWDGTVEEPAGPRLPDIWNVIEFPRTEDERPRAEELAEPVLETPRILDAPELIEQAIPAPLSEITLEDDSADEALFADDIEIPLQVAPLPQRVFGGLVDFLVVLVATALFGLIVLKISGAVPLSKAVLAAALAVPCFFWIAYHYLFLVYAAATPGMHFASVTLTDFDGEPVRQRVRRFRALAIALSSVSLGLGFVWALVDEDTLCWHDRISRTYPVQVTDT